MDATDDSDHPMLKAFGDLPTWQKAAIAVTGVMIAPWALFVGLITGLSVFPFVLLGKFEGSAPKGTMERDVERALRHRRERVEQYYGST